MLKEETSYCLKYKSIDKSRANAYQMMLLSRCSWAVDTPSISVRVVTKKLEKDKEKGRRKKSPAHRKGKPGQMMAA